MTRPPQQIPQPAAGLLWILLCAAILSAASLAAAEDPEIEAGTRLFATHCAACHGLNGTGAAGPNLTDQASTHGNGYYDIFDVILNGVKDKPMEAWRDRLTVPEIEQVTAYVFSLQASRPKDEETDKSFGYRF